jgi:hypothetical protein
MNDLKVQLTQKELLKMCVFGNVVNSLVPITLAFMVGRIFEYGSVSFLYSQFMLFIIIASAALTFYFLMKHSLNDSAIKNVRKTQQASRV